uniref:Uncharacterized protein n=1 Tax=Hyaloperonospora arabidopsidis (strain Emoy2) TaxID=559515 RepID=M4BWK1_HYAAE
MGTKRKKGDEVVVPPSRVSGLSYVAAERPPPATKALKTAAASVSTSRRFGFKGLSISQLPTPTVPAAASTTFATSIKTKRPRVACSLQSTDDGDTVTTNDDAVGSALAIEVDVHVRAQFDERFGHETVAALEQLLAFRHKTNKFAVKARKEEQINYIKQLKAGVRDVLTKIQEFGQTTAAIDDKLAAEKTALETRLAVLQQAARKSDCSEAELRKLRKEHDDLQKSIGRVRASEQEAVRSNGELRDNAAKLEIQLEETQKKNEQLQLTLKSHEARVVDESRRFKERKRELEQLHEKKVLEESKRKQVELEKLQEQLRKAREELALVQKDFDNYKEKALDAASSLDDERERRIKSEMEKCTLEATNQSLQARVSSAAIEVAELKEKLQHKDEEVSNLVRSLTDMQKFNASASTKVEADKRELADKIEQLHATIRDLERQESSSSTTARDLSKQLELAIKSQKKAEKSEQEICVRMKKLESELNSNVQKVGVEGGVRQMLENQVRELRTEHIAVNAQLEAVKAEMMRLQSANADSKEQHTSQLGALELRFQQERDDFRYQIDKLQEEKVSLESEVQTLRTRVSSARDGDVEELCKVQREADVLRRRLGELTSQGAQSIAQKDDMILELQEKIKQGDKLRRAMHNTIQVRLLW